MEVSGNDGVERLGLANEPDSGGIDCRGRRVRVSVATSENAPIRRLREFTQHVVELDVRVVFSNFIDDLVPHDHAVPLGIRLGDVCEHFTRAGARQLEGELGDAPHSDSGENGDLYREGRST